MQCRLLDVPAALRPYVQAFWAADSAAASGQQRTFQAVADGAPGLLVRLSGGAPVTAPGYGPLPEAMVYGQATVSRQLVSEGRFRAFGAVFRPDALHTVFGLRANELTDGCADLHDLLPKQTALAPGDPSTDEVEHAMAQVAAALKRCIDARGRAVDAVVASALDHVEACAGMIAPADLHKALGVSERALQRRFEQHLGISPRTYLRLVRFRTSLRALDQGAPERLSDVAFDSDYADQSHHIRTFREFVGVTPGQYTSLVRPVATNFVEVHG